MSVSENSSIDSFKCYMLGTIHVNPPSEDKLKPYLGSVDYVMLENVRLVINADSWIDRLISLPVIVSFYIYVVFLASLIHLKGLVSVMTSGRAVLVTDETYVQHIVSLWNKSSESRRLVVVWPDPTLGEIVREVRTAIAIVSTVSGAAGLAYGLLVFDNLLITVTSSILLASLSSFAVIIFMASDFRDEKVADEIAEVKARGARGVLVVRGVDHIDSLAEKLRARGIECEVIK